jgi:AAA domain, putative AbiEii toxin, Type IV TA system
LNSAQRESNIREFEILKQHVIRIDEEIEAITSVKTTSDTASRSMFDFVPTHLQLSNPSEWNRNTLREQSTHAASATKDSWHTTTPGRIQHCIERFFVATHPQLAPKMSEEKAPDAIDEFGRLKSIIRELIGTELDYDENRDALLFGRKFDEQHLSQGQIVLLQLALAVHSQGTRLRDLVLRLDEPETHLHPAVVIEIIHRLCAVVTNGQIWIATHSIPLIAQFSSSIWFMEGGQVQFAGSMPQKVLEGLVGGEENIANLEEFLSLPSQMAITNFAVEALRPPNVASPHSGDPQLRQIRDCLEALREGSALRILDYGAGRGRLLSSLFDDFSGSKQRFPDEYQYLAFDPLPEHADECRAAIRSAYSDEQRRFFSTETDLLANVDTGSIHCIVMCNVLHEIDPREWLNIFSPSGALVRLLAENGILLIVEDHCLPHGERAHGNGFLVLTPGALQVLFQVQPSDRRFSTVDARGDGRLLAHSITRSALLDARGRSSITAESRENAISAVNRTSQERIGQSRSAPPTVQNGRQLAFWLHQFANSELALRELTGVNR